MDGHEAIMGFSGQAGEQVQTTSEQASRLLLLKVSGEMINDLLSRCYVLVESEFNEDDPRRGVEYSPLSSTILALFLSIVFFFFVKSLMKHEDPDVEEKKVRLTIILSLFIQVSVH
jgi:hypothetical protein